MSCPCPLCAGRLCCAAGTPYRKGQRYYFSHNSGLQNQSVVRCWVVVHGGKFLLGWR